MSPFDIPPDPTSCEEECPKYEMCPGVHDCLLEPDPDVVDEDDLLVRRIE